MTGGGRGRRLLPLVLVLVAGAAGCSQTNPQSVTEATLTAPLVLNSAPGAAPVATGTAVAPAAAPPPASSQSAAAPVAAAPPPTALQTEPMPTTAAAAATEAEGAFPNINKAPGQPGGTLLAEDARAQIISQLEALREKQAPPGGAGSGGKPSDLANQASTHGQAAIDQIEACSQEGALQNNPACAPAD